MPRASQLANINSMPLVPFAQITALPRKYCPRRQGFAAATLFLYVCHTVKAFKED